MKSHKKSKLSVRRILGRLSVLKVLVMLIAVVCFISAVAMTVTSQPGFCNSCHIMNSYYASWEHSSHHEVSCLSCHLKPGLGSYMQGKITGLAQAVDCMVGRIGTKAEATVQDVSCLRSACHNAEKLKGKEIEFGIVKFTHDGHIGETVDGIAITCGTCHSHVGGEDHFEVNTQACFACHFLDDKKTEKDIVQTECQGCHDVPDKVIEHGKVKVNHSEFASYQTDCNDSCHKKLVNVESRVENESCYSCHEFSLEHETDAEKLHEYHTHAEKVECSACHRQVSHGYTQTSSVSSMIDCENCHSDTHSVQQEIFTAAEDDSNLSGAEKVLSPMFLTHVQCTGCHIEKTPASSGVLDSFGTVARPVPEACDKCHEPGTGDKYIPFWQGSIKKMYGQTMERLEKLQEIAEIDSEGPEAKARMESIKQVSSILKSVKADGSWGIHNFKYTEAILLKANDIISEVEKD